ncbi:MAG: hypothetical protein JWM81_27 [Candidatus Saccharibacteria bacterium]|nr:hypothetical protein [Candidatus Saccharibacteria bacterium]
MATNERPHFSERLLHIGEQAQHAIGQSALSKSVVRTLTGSRSPAYRQVVWQSRGVLLEDQDVETVHVAGNPNSALLARNWNIAAIIASEVVLLDNIRTEYAQFKFQDAVAYIADGTAHVGILPDSSEALFGVYAENPDDEITIPAERAIAMRLGKGPLEVTMGIWVPSERLYVGAESVRVVEPIVPVDAVARDYPGVILV